RLQEMFGVSVHPTLGPRRTPVVLELLSPAQRPVQTTSDLPGFWAASYADVRRDMRLQEMFGVSVHPTLGPRRTPVVLELLSPAQRP
ncbi:hypothetical protein CNY89_28400, partial [Amaricoccus sp. HAR-UPW-R2A-40]